MQQVEAVNQTVVEASEHFQISFSNDSSCYTAVILALT